MAMINPTPLACSLSRARGFLAGLIFINSLPKIAGQDFNANIRLFQNTKQWTVLQHVHRQLEETRLRLVEVKRTISLECPDKTLASFNNPTSFYEAAISSFHNTLLGLPPTTLGGVVALCAMSHATSCYLYSTGIQVAFDPFSDFDLWRSTISNDEHQQAFDDLMMAACQEPYLTTLMNPFPIFQDEINLPSEDLNLLWSPDPITNTLIPFLITHNAAGESQAPDLQSLQGSPIVANLTHFLEQCGELPLILCGRDATADMCYFIGAPISTESGDEQDLKHLYIQLLRERGPLHGPVTQGIVSIVERFVDLGYLQSVDEVPDYMLLIGKEILPSNKTFLELCKSAWATLAEAKRRLHNIPCGKCGKVFTRPGNMKRYMERKARCAPLICNTLGKL
ncbi:unnamed protein product [Fusarium graminearum]|nr:unnamed protein product [Fusarium graminearum]